MALAYRVCLPRYAGTAILPPLEKNPKCSPESGMVSSRFGTPVVKVGGPGFNSLVAAVVFSSSSWLTNVDGMKDQWCPNTIWLLSTQIRMG